MAQVESKIKESSSNDPSEEALVATLPTREGWSTPLTLHNNFWLRSHMAQKFMLVRDNFKPRRDDIILATHPKSGTTWLKALAFTISTRSRYDFADADHPLRTSNPQRVVPFIGAVGGDLDFLETLPSPRLLSTHLPLSLLPPAVSAVGCRVVYLCREPKDALVSRWHFDNKMSKGDPITLDDAFTMFCEGFSPFGPFWDHYLQYWEESLARPQEVMFLRYEEIVSDPLKVARKLASFLDAPFTEDEEKSGVVDQVVSFCSFESLRNLDVNKTGGAERAGGKIFIQHSSLFRKGKVGDWVNHMTKEMGEKMDRLVEEKFKGSGLEF
ncbi:Sulfotransferase 16 [Hordeum vulgare]|uniref:Sulfotransferase n=1 Tax=Hordeum vulgare subsp. vulgare TaxID=112509 RepID=F2DYX0_HORVV|nr:Sulfotransferase 16 [Hordeum vulgare]BAK00292.1 predicted protein [Hordeum vulgare subsp. vulgare]BAK00379.1 predicted protein [Hordeum vulgare subsp. vulgare]